MARLGQKIKGYELITVTSRLKTISILNVFKQNLLGSFHAATGRGLEGGVVQS